jgi:hypothetical protein
MRNRASRIAGAATARNSDGVASSPRVTNIAIWLSHVVAA